LKWTIWKLILDLKINSEIIHFKSIFLTPLFSEWTIPKTIFYTLSHIVDMAVDSDNGSDKTFSKWRLVTVAEGMKDTMVCPIKYEGQEKF